MLFGELDTMMGNTYGEFRRTHNLSFNRVASMPVDFMTYGLTTEECDANGGYSKKGGDILQVKEVKLSPRGDRVIVYIGF